MQESDAAVAADLANAVHLSYPEDPLVIRDRLAIYPKGCFVLADASGLHGYFVCHPWVIGAPPALNSALGALPPHPNCFYLHDMALLQWARGKGHAFVALDIILKLAREDGLTVLFLTAVGDAHGFWERAGFAPYETYSADPSKGYGPEARAYVRPVDGPVSAASGPR